MKYSGQKEKPNDAQLHKMKEILDSDIEEWVNTTTFNGSLHHVLSLWVDSFGIVEHDTALFGEYYQAKQHAKRMHSELSDVWHHIYIDGRWIVSEEFGTMF